jgi:membrane-bound lytic murein transglycosylase D
VEKAVEHTGYADYWELRARHAIPAETTNYVPIILAMTIMAKNAPEYGLDQVVPDQPMEYDTIKVNATTNLGLISDLTEASVPELQQLNPALLRTTAPEGFELRVPKGMGEMTAASLEQVPADRRVSARIHRVETGESLAAIAKHFSTTPASIASLNQLSGTEVQPGDKLIIPAAFRDAAPPVARGKVVTARNGRRPATVATARKSAPATTVAAKKPVRKTAGTIASVAHKPKVLTR